ncbi:MAG: 16S rRNA (guanine(966)-N(2))-methyltransferase RsmD [Acidobacteria bacterium]|nr:16S rRNA (guanine(966)-N(2))-methyltransferase RsmD [Acidobacteriota bacterium]
MRVIAGTYKGRRLTAPPGLEVRPAPDRLKEAVFNVIQFRLGGSSVLDLCAGSGAMGIEAISRGAGATVMVERSAPALKSIRENLQQCAIDRGFEVLASDALAAVEELSNRSSCFDFVFFDPPYASTIYEPVMARLGRGDVLAEGGQVIVMHHHRRELASVYGVLKSFRQLRQGENVLSFFRADGLTPSEPVA